MTGLTGIGNSLKTPMGYLDNSRPLAMADADNIFKRLQFEFGSEAQDAMVLASEIADVIVNTKSGDIDELWTQLERRLNKGRPIKTKAKTDEAKVNTAFGMIYSALTVIDSKATSSSELEAMSNLFFETDLHVTGKLVSKMTGTDKRVGLRISDTIRKRISDMTDRFNELIEEGKLAGNPL